MAKNTKKYLIKDTVIIDEIYPLVESAIDGSNKTFNDIKAAIQKFVHNRHAQLYDYAPIDRIFFRKQEVTDFFKAIGFKEAVINVILPKLYYWNSDELQACKDPFSLTFLMVLRYMAKKKANDKKNIELFYTYYAFSGKYYASCHSAWFRHYIPRREVMDYVINYMLNGKYDIIKTGSVWGAIRNLTTTWYDSYKDELATDLTDERICYLIHQLHNRVYAFLRNIAKPYYEAAEKKLYLNAESDDYSQEKYRIANNNSTVAYNITEKAINYMVNSQVNIGICYQVSGSGVDPYEIKAIFENIMSKNETLEQLREVINILLVDFMREYPDDKEYTGAKFIAHSISMKPNSKDPNILKLKNTVYTWLNMSERYRNIKTPATQNNYYKGILSYIAINVNIANK